MKICGSSTYLKMRCYMYISAPGKAHVWISWAFISLLVIASWWNSVWSNARNYSALSLSCMCFKTYSNHSLKLRASFKEGTLQLYLRKNNLFFKKITFWGTSEIGLEYYFENFKNTFFWHFHFFADFFSRFLKMNSLGVLL